METEIGCLDDIVTQPVRATKKDAVSQEPQSTKEIRARVRVFKVRK